MFITAKKTIVCLIVAVVLAASLVSCASTKAGVAAPEKAPAVLTKEDARMFWSISGTDKNGNPSKIYIQGTFHIADQRCYPLADIVQNAFITSDRFYGEISSEGMAELSERIQDKYMESIEVAGGRLISDSLSEEDGLFLKQLVGEESFNALNTYGPWVLTTTLDSSLFIISGFAPEYGLDTVFLNSATALGKNVEGLDTVDCQLDVLSFGTYEQQIVNLQNILNEYKDLETAKGNALAFYQGYLDDDEKKVEEMGFGELENETLSAEEIAYNKEYEQVMVFDRNEKWAGIFEDLLEEGGTTFVYAGTLHFVGDHSVFSYMQENGTLVIE